MIFIKLEMKEKNVSKNIHPLFLTRGVPGTHDHKAFIKNVYSILKKKFKKY